MIANYIDEFIMLCAGLWMTGVGFGYFQLPAEVKPGQRPWWMQIVAQFKWMGPLLIIIAVFLAVYSPR
jgi:hypothetical protein